MGIKSRIKQIAKIALAPPAKKAVKKTYDGESKSNTEHWTDHNVTFHAQFKTKQQSLEHLDWRNSQYLFYDELMPCNEFDGQVVLDYGCGPGHDTIALSEFSKPKKIYAIDISKTAIAEAKSRIQLHNPDVAEFILIEDGAANFPFENESIDYIHCSGVLHHTPNENDILKEFYRVLKKGGKARIMMYNYNSMFAQIYVGYEQRVCNKVNADISFADALRKSSDYNCPIARYYRKEEFIEICNKVGFNTTLKGIAIHNGEMLLMPIMYQALGDLKK